MSHSVHIDIGIIGKLFPLEVISALLENGWTYNDHGHISFLPIGDNGNFNWQWEELEKWAEVLEKLHQKQELQETVGLAITWLDTLIGGNLLFFRDCDYFSFSICINIQTLKNCSRFTDFSWYLAKIITPLEEKRLRIKFLKCEEAV